MTTCSQRSSVQKFLEARRSSLEVLYGHSSASELAPAGSQINVTAVPIVIENLQESQRHELYRRRLVHGILSLNQDDR